MKRKHFNLAIPFALILGVLLGYLNVPWALKGADVIAQLFIRVLKLISLPMIFLAIVSTMTQMSSLSEVGTLLRKILKYTIGTTLVAATIGMLLFWIIEPSQSGLHHGQIVEAEGSYLSFLINIIPENLVEPFLENNVLGMAFIGAVLSLAILKLPEKQSHLLRDVFGALFDALLKVTSALILLMPLGIFAFTIQFVHSMQSGTESFSKILLYALCVIGANLIQGFIILPLMLKLKGHSPMRIAKGMLPALAMAFFTKSSNAALPLSMECAQNKLGISEKTSRFSLPLCSIINMNGCAAFILITVLFVCTSQGMTFTFLQMIPWIFLASIAAIGNAGVPMGCYFLTTAFLIGMGVPIEMMGIILPLYSLFDMVETALNVWSDSCITATVDGELEELKVIKA